MSDHPFTIKPGQQVYLIPSMVTVRKTRNGPWLCKLNGIEVPIPETMIRNKAANDYILDGTLPEDK